MYRIVYKNNNENDFWFPVEEVSVFELIELSLAEKVLKQLKKTERLFNFQHSYKIVIL